MMLGDHHDRRVGGVPAGAEARPRLGQAVRRSPRPPSAQSWALSNYCPAPGPVPTAPSNRDYAPGFMAALMLKDVKLSQAAAEATGAPTPLGAHATRALSEAGRRGRRRAGFLGDLPLARRQDRANARIGLLLLPLREGAGRGRTARRIVRSPPPPSPLAGEGEKKPPPRRKQDGRQRHGDRKLQDGARPAADPPHRLRRGDARFPLAGARPVQLGARLVRRRTGARPAGRHPGADASPATARRG